MPRRLLALVLRGGAPSAALRLALLLPLLLGPGWQAHGKAQPGELRSPQDRFHTDLIPILGTFSAPHTFVARALEEHWPPTFLAQGPTSPW
uniref:Uncharacterized protein n=1 Tax=Sphaerodactylus townsendi TaxID=933632 RepID=A0ACB8ETY6_9SAUR